jgi:hypothetical protein
VFPQFVVGFCEARTTVSFGPFKFEQSSGHLTKHGCRTKQIADPAGTRPIVETIMSLARSLGMRTVAEGVETQAQLEIIRELDCDLIQGFLFSRPISGPDVLELLRTRCSSGPLRQSPNLTRMLSELDCKI